MKNNKKTVALIYYISAIICLLLSAIVYGVISIQEMTKMEQDGNVFIQNVEAFYSEHNRLPENSELLYCESEHGTGPFYEKKSDVTYSIYFCLGFDNYYEYNSNNKKWHYFPHQTRIQTILQKIKDK